MVTVDPILEQRERVARARVLAQHHDADLRVRLSQPHRCLDPLVRVPRGHADVGDDHVRMLRLHGGEQGVEVAADGSDLEVGIGLEQTRDALAHEEMILGDHQPDWHGARIRL